MGEPCLDPVFENIFALKQCMVLEYQQQELCALLPAILKFKENQLKVAQSSVESLKIIFDLVHWNIFITPSSLML